MQVNAITQRETACKGGHSGDSFEPGGPCVREAGHKDGQESEGFGTGDPRARDAGKKGGLGGQPEE